MLKNQDGYLTIESAMVIPIILLIIMSLTFLLYKISHGDALTVIKDNQTLVRVLKDEPKIPLFYKIHLANDFGEVIAQHQEEKPKGND